jgi:hypothetical protein
MLYAFGDESRLVGTGGRGVAYLVIAVLQEQYSQRATDLRTAFRSTGKKRQHAILEILRGLQASVVLGKAEIPAHLKAIKFIEEPSTGRLSLNAVLWAWMFGFTCSAALLAAIQSGSVFSCADFYHDPQDLTSSHRKHIDEIMRETLQEQLGEFSVLRFGSNAPRPVLRRIMSVPKSPAPFSPQRVQLGVACADELLTFALKSREEARGLIQFEDFSNTVAELLSKGEIITRG